MTSADSARVPAALTSFVGRVADLAALEAALEATRWIAIVGPPGVGKTRLVGELVRTMTERDTSPPGGVWWIELAGATTTAEAVATIATVLGVAADGGTLLERVAAALAPRGPTLVVLDEVDALGPEVARLISTLLTGAANLQVAVTSRSRTAASGEASFDLQPLEVGDAVALFVDRARAVQRGFELAPWAAAVTQLVDTLDRLPLAIELAAGRVRVTTPAQLVERPGLLFGMASHDRLGAALETAWDGLTSAQRAALLQLAVFRGGFDLDAATAVLARDGDASTLDEVAALCDQSLVVSRPTDDGVRFDVLTIVKEYLRRHPSDPDLSARHARYVLALAARLVGQLDGPDAQRARARLLAERANLLAVIDRARDREDECLRDDALAAAIAVASPQIRAGSYRELSEFLATSLDRVDDRRRPSLCAEAWWLRGEALRQVGSLDEAAACYARVQAIGERVGDANILARAGYGAAAIEFSRGELATAVELYRTRVLELAGAPDPVVVTRALSDLGVIETVLGHVVEAGQAFDRALREARAGRCVTGEGRALVGRGQLEQQAGRLDDARTYFEQAIEIHERVGDRRSVAIARFQLGLNHHLRRELEPAAACYRAALAITEHVGHRLLEAIVISALGACAHAAGRLDEARRHFEQAVGAFEQLGHASYRAVLAARLAALAADRGDLAAARALLAAAEATLPASADREVTEAIAVSRIHVELADGGDPEVARAHLATALAGAVDVRVQALVLARRLEGGAPVKRRLVVGARARWFNIDQGERVSLERRAAPSRLLAALVDERVAAPGDVMLADQLFAHGWPGQRASSESAAQRVYTAIWALRKLGLRDVIVRVAEGYFVDPAIDVVQRAD